MKKLEPVKFGLAAGILWGLYLFLTVPIYLYTGYAGVFFHLIADLYPGVDASIAGSLAALAWGFGDAFVCASLFALIYNKLLGLKVK